MTTAVIIEDKNKPNSNLILLKSVQLDIHIQAQLNTVKESIQYFLEQPTTDLIICDVQLTDGFSFSIFMEVTIKAPVIFITKKETFIEKVLDHNNFIYLLHPVTTADLAHAINKCTALNGTLLNNLSHFGPLIIPAGRKVRTRLIVKNGIEHVALPVDDIALFYTQQKICFAVDKNGKHHQTDKNLTDLEKELNSQVFFRANRQFIVNIKYIHAFKTYQKVKLQVILSLPEVNFLIIISQETAAAFRLWMAEEMY